MRLFIFLALVFTGIPGISQRIPLNTQQKPDNIQLWLRFPASTDSVYKFKMQESFLEGIQRFNQRKNYFIAGNDSSVRQSFIILNIDSTEYATRKQSRRSTIFNGALIAGHAIMISQVGWTLPVLFYFNPSTYTYVSIEISDNLLLPAHPKASAIVDSGALYGGIQRQQKRNIRKFSKTTHRILKKINRSYNKKSKQ